MNTLAKFKNYRQRRAELTATRIQQSRNARSANENARREMLLYTNRMM